MYQSPNPIPPGFHSITPRLVVRDTLKAIEFYKNAFGAEERFAMPGPGGKIMHAEIKIGDSIVFLNDECPEVGSLGPEARGGATSSLMIYSTDVDKAFARAVKAGCTVMMPLDNQFWGDRFACVIDPFGHVWGLSMHIQDLSPEDIKKGMEAAFGQVASAGAK